MLVASRRTGWWAPPWRDIDFTPARLEARWQAGLRDGRRVVRRAAWREPFDDRVGMRVHTLPPSRSR